MHLDIASLLFAMTVCMVTMAIALPAVMGEVNAPARCAQAGVVLQGIAPGNASLFFEKAPSGASLSQAIVEVR